MKRMRIFAAILAFCLLLPVAGLAKLPPEARQTLYKAQILMDDKKYMDAAAVIRQYMKSTQETIDGQVYVMLGGALHEAGKKQQALEVFRKGHQYSPDNECLCLNMGVTLYELERYAEAGKYLEKAYSLQKAGKDQLLFQAGSAYYLGEKYGEAARVLLRLMHQSKKPEKQWIRLTIHALIESGQTAKAESILIRYLNTNPQEGDYWKLLGKLHLDREEYSEAAAALEIAHRLTKPSRQDLERLASLYRYRNAPLMAAQTLQRAYGNSPDKDQALKVAALLASAGRTRQAVNYLSRHCSGGPVELEKGRILYQSRDFKKAETVLRKLVAKQNQPEARFYLALCAWERKDWKTAKAELTRVAGQQQFKSRARAYLAVLSDLDEVRKEAME